MSSHFSSWNFQAYRMYTVFDGERTGLEQERERERKHPNRYHEPQMEKGTRRCTYIVSQEFIQETRWLAAQNANKVHGTPKLERLGARLKRSPTFFVYSSVTLASQTGAIFRGKCPRNFRTNLFFFFFFSLQEGWRQTTNRCLSIKIHRAQGKPINFRVTNRNDYNYISEDSRLHHEYESP